jgi:hypothetical protein
MRKLNQLQKEMIMKNFKMGATLIKWTEKVGNDKNDLQEDIMLAEDMIKEKQ